MQLGRSLLVPVGTGVANDHRQGKQAHHQDDTTEQDIEGLHRLVRLLMRVFEESIAIEKR